MKRRGLACSTVLAVSLVTVFGGAGDASTARLSSPKSGRPALLVGAGSEKRPAAYTIRDRVLNQERIAFRQHAWLPPREYRNYAVVIVSATLTAKDIHGGAWDEPDVKRHVEE